MFTKAVKYAKSLVSKPKKTADLTKKQNVYKKGMAKTGVIAGTAGLATGLALNNTGPKTAKAPPIKKSKTTKKSIPTKTPTPRPKKKNSGVTFEYEVIPKGGKTKKLFGGGKIGGMKVGPSTPNKLY